MEMTKKLLLATVITSMFAANVFAGKEVVPPAAEEENTEKTFYEEHKTAILSVAAILGAVAVVTGGYFGYQYCGKDLCAKLFSKTAPKVETKTTPVKTTFTKKAKAFVKNGWENTKYCAKNPKYTVNQVKTGAKAGVNYCWDKTKNGGKHFVNFFKGIGTFFTTDSDKTVTKTA